MFLFDKNAITPDELDAFVFRPLTYPSDNGVFAYRAPKPDKQYGANIYRMMMGGLMFFIKLDRRSFPEGAVSKILMKNANGLPYLTTPVVGLEEFEMARESFQKNQGLSEYLDKNP
ncbi:MAG: hypothetical protein KDA86_04055 [Planctomycetaceae bacterium]|nr:hypothetical protein [Planctomycetaceae bacterium]